MPKAFSEHEKELIGKHLLDQAYRLFSAYGLRKTSIEEIANAAGISKGAFYGFYDSKEALFMDVLEQAETRVRQEIIAVIDMPGPSHRARLFAVMHKAFALFSTIPILRVFTGSDYDLLFRRIPAAKLQEHLASDYLFLEQLIAHCRDSNIPIQVEPGQLIGLLYPLVLALLHQDEVDRYDFANSIDLLLELVAAYCLGEVQIQIRKPVTPV